MVGRGVVVNFMGRNACTERALRHRRLGARSLRAGCTHWEATMILEEVQPIEVNGEGFVGFTGAIDGATAIAEELPLDDDSDESKRSPRVRARTISIKRLSKRELERGRQLFPIEQIARPENREACLQGTHAERPCPFVSCKHHLYLDVNDRTGSIKLNFPDLEVWELPETCALDIADRGGITLEEVGEIMNLTRERIRQLETRGLAKLKALSDMAALQDYME